MEETIDRSAANPPEPAIGALEVLGALSARLTHILSNHLSIMTGNLCVAAALRDEPDKKAAALNAAMNAANEAGNLMGRYLDLRRSVRTEAAPTPVEELLRRVQAWVERHSGWEMELDREPRKSATVPLSSRWLEFILDSVVEEAGIDRGIMRIAPTLNGRGAVGSTAAFPVFSGAGLKLSLLYTSERKIDWKVTASGFKHPQITAGYEMLRQIGGTLESRTVGPGLQEMSLTIPLA